MTTNLHKASLQKLEHFLSRYIVVIVQVKGVKAYWDMIIWKLIHITSFIFNSLTFFLLKQKFYAGFVILPKFEMNGMNGIKNSTQKSVCLY